MQVAKTSKEQLAEMGEQERLDAEARANPSRADILLVKGYSTRTIPETREEALLYLSAIRRVPLLNPESSLDRIDLMYLFHEIATELKSGTGPLTRGEEKRLTRIIGHVRKDMARSPNFKLSKAAK